MITALEAQQKIKNQTFSLQTTSLALTNALNYCLSEDIIAPVSIPLFNQSAMDGYAFNFEDINKPLQIVAEIPAGDNKTISINKGEAIRIFTGSKVPDCCNTVVMQELTEVINNELLIKDEGLKIGGNIRTKGNQIKKGATALKKGTQINAGSIGFLSTLGLTTINVYRQPKVTIIATGNELVKPGSKLLAGQIFESNTFMLKAALQQKGIDSRIIIVEDNQKITELAIKKALSSNDLLIISGGISVGDYDFVKESLENNNVNEVFYKVKQKPGKPLYFGKTDSCYVYALPGNPAAALSCFYEYVNTSINIMMGNNKINLPQLKLPINKTYTKKAGRANFLKAYTDFKTVTPLDGQSSDALQAFSMANCLIYTTEEDTKICEGTVVEIHLLPQEK